MPRKPTTYSRQAEEALRGLIGEAKKAKDVPLPTVRHLANEMNVSYSTISRILSRFVQESVVWKHPNGRFYPISMRKRISKSMSIVILGRQIQHWSVLYREVVEGVSEICSARGYPLVFLSSDKLVYHDSLDLPPVFASKSVQSKELARLLSSLPKPCGGILFDHLWSDKLIAAACRSYPTSTLLVRESLDGMSRSVAIHAEAGAELVLNHLAECGYSEILIGVPFIGDQAIEASKRALETILARGKPAFQAVSYVDCSTPQAREQLFSRLRNVRRRVALISLEDNVTTLLWRGFELSALDCPGTIGLVSTQGTAALGSPVTRLRFDYRDLGREAVSALLSEKPTINSLRPSLIRGRTTASLT